MWQPVGLSRESQLRPDHSEIHIAASGIIRLCHDSTRAAGPSSERSACLLSGKSPTARLRVHMARITAALRDALQQGPRRQVVVADRVVSSCFAVHVIPSFSAIRQRDSSRARQLAHQELAGRSVQNLQGRRLIIPAPRTQGPSAPSTEFPSPFQGRTAPGLR